MKIITALFILGTFGVSAQTIAVEFPKLAGKPYSYMLDKGDHKDTIAKGVLDAAGKAKLIVPADQKGYRGMSHLVVDQNKTFDLVVNKENFSVTCQEESAILETTIYIGSPENDFVKNNYLAQKKVLEKAKLMQYALGLYTANDTFYPVIEKEKEALNQQFTAVKKERAQSALYAAAFLDIYDAMMGVGSSLDMTEQAKANEINSFIRDKMDFEVLYTSGYWNTFIYSWVEMQQVMIKDDAKTLAAAKQMLSRIKSNTTYTALAEKLVSNFTRTGKDDLVSGIGQYVAKSGRVVKPNNNLQMAMKGPFVGAPAPALVNGKTTKAIKGKTVLFFFESGCNNCENEIHQFLGNYEVLKDKGYEVITVSADMTPNAGDGHDHTFPWKEQICDYKGLTGINFKNYGAIGTPTIFVMDEKGNITGKYPRLVDTGILNN